MQPIWPRVVDVPGDRLGVLRGSARGTGRGRPTPGPCAGSGGRRTRTARTGSSRWAGRPARCRRPPPAARRGRSCRRRRRSKSPSRRASSACQSCQASKSRSRRVTRRPALLEDVQVVAAAAVGVEEAVQLDVVARGSTGSQLPAEHPPGVVGVVLRVAAGAHVEEDAARGLPAPSPAWANCRPSCVLPMPVEPTTTVSVPGSSPPPSSSSRPGDAGGKS